MRHDWRDTRPAWSLLYVIVLLQTGIVTESDLIVRLIPRRTPRWWDLMFRDREALARDYRKAVGTTVATS